MYGALVAEARRSRGLTQVQLAEVSGVRQANISAIEHGRRTPSAETLHRLLHACGYELTATAGSRVLACPPPDADDMLLDLLAPDPLDEPPVVTRRTPATERSQVLSAVLAAAASIAQSR